MPNPLIAVAGIGAGGSALAAKSQSDAASDAADAQIESDEAAIAEQRRQFDAVQELMKPFIETGTSATAAMANLAGINGADAQAAGLLNIENSPQLASAIAQGENALLQNASATGGLRGGNTQGALAQLRPQMFSQMIDQRYGQLSGLAGMGQASAAGQANAAQNTGNNVSSLLQSQGAASAGASLASGQATAQAIGGFTGALGNIASGYGAAPAGATPFGSWGF